VLREPGDLDGGHGQERLPDLPDGVRWSVCVRDARSGRVVHALDAERRHPTASIGKLLLLIAAARAFAAGELRRDQPLTRTEGDSVRDSGLWQHLASDTLPAQDVALLIAAVSDNLATNVLLNTIGLAELDALAGSLGLAATRLLDKVRDERGPGDPEMLSSGSAAELSGLMHGLWTGSVVSEAVSREVLAWLAIDVDLSMVASAFALDPLAHFEVDRGVLLRNKTGTNRGVRADVGVVESSCAALAYAALASWEPGVNDPRDAVLAAMRNVGSALRDALA
jgi:beta-lactamase class A